MRIIGTEELRSILTLPGTTLIDLRCVDAYNGWTFRNESRGGHIHGARSLPSKWLSDAAWIDIARAKGIEPDQEIILYADAAYQIQQAGREFTRAGCTNIATYYWLVEEWMPNRDLPMDRLVNYRHLVPAEWLAGLLETGSAPTCDNDRFILCHVHCQNRSDYEKGHIPGAFDLNTSTLESSRTWNRRSSAELRETLESNGITHDTTVIVYDRFSLTDNRDPSPGSSAGHLGAMRCALIMMYAGVQDVRVLNGGLQAWLDAGFELTSGDSPKRPLTDFGAPIPGRPDLIVDTAEAKAILKEKGKNLISVRSWDEFVGNVSGSPYIEKKGRIPGAVFGNGGSDAYPMENYRNLDYTTREYHEIERMWNDAGIMAQQTNAFFCSTGWRGSEAFFNAWLMGWPHVSVYDGGWFEWSRDENNPYKTGSPNHP